MDYLNKLIGQNEIWPLIDPLFEVTGRMKLVSTDDPLG